MLTETEKWGRNKRQQYMYRLHQGYREHRLRKTTRNYHIKSPLATPLTIIAEGG